MVNVTPFDVCRVRHTVGFFLQLGQGGVNLFCIVSFSSSSVSLVLTSLKQCHACQECRLGMDQLIPIDPKTLDKQECVSVFTFVGYCCTMCFQLVCS